MLPIRALVINPDACTTVLVFVYINQFDYMTQTFSEEEFYNAGLQLHKHQKIYFRVGLNHPPWAIWRNNLSSSICLKVYE